MVVLESFKLLPFIILKFYFKPFNDVIPALMVSVMVSAGFTFSKESSVFILVGVILVFCPLGRYGWNQPGALVSASL